MMTSFLARFAIVLSFLTISAVNPAGAQQVGQPAPAAPVISTEVSAQPAANQPAAGQASPISTAPASAESGAARAGKAVATGLDELSPLGMFLKADMIVKAVMIALALASVASWTILIAKSIEFSVLRGRLTAALRKLTAAKSLAEAQLALGQGNSAKNVASTLLHAAISEARLSAGLNSDEGIKERAASSFTEIVRAEARRVRVGMGLLATVGAISPFVGLFGTVWGIMNSFIGISKSQTTNLAVVAPGIAEALLATAIGLAAAIPAVIIYNHFSRVTKGYLELVNRASGATGRLLSRDLDRSHISVHARAAE
ncbi:biopolymer transport protein ExbB; uptake of enterobactin, tonB-dependent uptake of B colicins [Bradyrhizobium sp. ORS 285]|uniref:tonB-system energizer ExbB n=1 Tax=Bradyrhizobium sp. ORS 285 TaxID=115808 RepID=UPI0002407269|nr:tonB-system energizer ExbB [Bradyrhizobium sp. ORS 285]CCD83768.1 biopolymer transport protein ExbB; uptake of enterobactin, tonB-dependent uptake of B colicins [Bradyrhizobium sp. ORS 285]SMX59312.1 biopolymer transport protein ExbB; uptake of enterobactin, tonB-dependent uptake of B colicins [Bradyrhizobium sp. ORS 285]